MDSDDLPESAPEAADEPPAKPDAAEQSPVVPRPRARSGEISWFRQELRLRAEHSEGPLPSGRELQRYRDADPSAPRIILEEFRAESQHRRQVELEIVEGEGRRADRGQVFALCIIIFGLSISGFLIHAGHDWAGGFIGGMDLLGMAALFLSSGVPLREDAPAAASAHPHRPLPRGYSST